MYGFKYICIHKHLNLLYCRVCTLIWLCLQENKGQDHFDGFGGCLGTTFQNVRQLRTVGLCLRLGSCECTLQYDLYFHVYTYICVCVCVCACVCVCIFTHARTYIYIYLCICIMIYNGLLGIGNQLVGTARKARLDVIEVLYVYRVIPGHRNHRNDPASVFVSTH